MGVIDFESFGLFYAIGVNGCFRYWGRSLAVHILLLIWSGTLFQSVPFSE